MTLRSIFEIRQEGFDSTAYINDLVSDRGFAIATATEIINELRNCSDDEVPLSDGLFYRLLTIYYEFFILPEGSDDDREVIDISTFCHFDLDDTVRMSFVHEGQEMHLFLTQSQYSTLRTVLDHCVDYEDDEVHDIIARYETPLTSSEIEACSRLHFISYSTIPENSETLLIKENTSRFSGAMWFEAIQQKTIILAGVGGIGSYVGFLLARMHPRSMFIYDDDRVEAANMSGQLYGKTDIGKFKVDALAGMVSNYADYSSIFAIDQRYTAQCEATDIMICGFDNMEARKLFFHKWKAHVEMKPPTERSHCLFIDGRLAAEELQVFCITGDNSYGITEYETKYLFSDEEAEDTVCSYKQTSYMANMIGSIIVNLFTNFVANELLGFLGRDLPFFTQYSGLSMQLKIE